MTKDDILTMASEAYCWHVNLSGDRAASIARLQRFAELVAAHERNRTWTQNHWTEYERSIVATEREACAKLCEDLDDGDYAGGDQPYGLHYARAIRARGQE